METKAIKVAGMSCEHCKAAVEKGVNEMEGVDRVLVDLSKGEALISFDASVIQEEVIKEGIRSLGYQA
jgi:copper ion binding protein